MANTLRHKFSAEKLFNAQKVRNCQVYSIFVGLSYLLTSTVDDYGYGY